MVKTFLLLSLFTAKLAFAGLNVEGGLPSHYTGLNDYVLVAPNQGQVNTCLFMASTGAMEILLNKKMGIHHPQVNGPTDISERYTISEAVSARSNSWFEDAFL